MPSPVWNPLAKDERLRALALPARGTALSPAAAQELALTVGLRGVGQVAPNPLVGAVIVDEAHRFVAAGAHERVGGHHGEFAALVAATGEDWRGKMRGHTLYVTLEPCAHEGKRTPPCAPRLVEAGFARVVYGALDPNPMVNGRGIAILQAAGIEAVFAADWARGCAALAEVYLTNAARGRPFVGLKAAATLDGVIARRGDRRSWITGARARQYGHFLRLWYDAVLVGRGTVEADDPMLDPRDAIAGQKRPPFRVVLDPQMRAYDEKRAMLALAPARVLWVVGADVTRARAPIGTRILGLPVNAAGAFAAADVLAALSKEGITSVLIEGGAGSYGAFLGARLIDKLHLFQAPVVFGAEDAVRWSDGAGRLAMDRAKTIDLTPLEDDWVVEAAWGDP